MAEDSSSAATRPWRWRWACIAIYYHPRWKWFLDEVGKALDSGQPFDSARFHGDLRKWMEAWSDSSETYPSEPSGDSVAVARRLWMRYGDACEE